VRLRDARRYLADELVDKAAEAKRLTDTIATIDETKKEMLESASFPIPNVRLDEDGVFLNGEPLENASQKERIEFAVAVGMAVNPDVRLILIRDGSLLDDEAKASLDAMAHERGFQVWLECVKSDTGIIIEDGAVLDDVPAEQGAA